MSEKTQSAKRADDIVGRLHAAGIREFFNSAPVEAAQDFEELINLAVLGESSAPGTHAEFLALCGGAQALRLHHAMEEFRRVRRVTENTPTVIQDFVNENSGHPVSGGHVFSRQLHAAMGISDEAGEVLAIFKKTLFGYKKPPPESLSKELGDVFWYFDLMLEAAEIDFASLLLENAAKLRERHAEKFKAIDDMESFVKNEISQAVAASLDNLGSSEFGQQPLGVLDARHLKVVDSQEAALDVLFPQGNVVEFPSQQDQG